MEASNRLLLGILAYADPDVEPCVGIAVHHHRNRCSPCVGIRTKSAKGRGTKRASTPVRRCVGGTPDSRLPDSLLRLDVACASVRMTPRSGLRRRPSCPLCPPRPPSRRRLPLGSPLSRVAFLPPIRRLAHPGRAPFPGAGAMPSRRSALPGERHSARGAHSGERPQTPEARPPVCDSELRPLAPRPSAP